MTLVCPFSRRFRQDGDEDVDPVLLSTEDELDPADPAARADPFSAALALHLRGAGVGGDGADRGSAAPPDRKDALETILAGQCSSC